MSTMFAIFAVRRGLLTLVRGLGLLALALMVYAWIYPARSSGWLGGDIDAKNAGPPWKQTGPPMVADAVWAPQVSRSQAAVAQWLGSKYHVAPEAIAPLVAESDTLSKSYRLSPNLVIAVMAIESNFHPYIESEAGAQGLMQVMPEIHAKRYEKFGGKSRFVDPIVSLKVGAEILRDCVKLKGGSEAEALRFYFGGGAASDAYIEKVRAEQHRLDLVAARLPVPVD